MLYNSKRKKLCKHLLVGGVVCLVGFAAFSCTDAYNLDEDQPSGLNTIYGYMQEKGTYTNFLQLINDLGEAEVLSKTGSKTLFIADDNAFAKFFASNDWGVGKYADLSLAQKKLLLYSAMIDNPYPTSMLSTAEGPVRGEVCRRVSSQSIFDSVQVVSTTSDELPKNERWTILQSTHPEIVLFKDASGASPMIHFTPKFIVANKLQSSDIDFLYNDPAGTRGTDDTYVNRAKILNSQFCKNGFVHEVDRVITPLDNMAEIIRKNGEMSIFSSIIERFAAPKDSSMLTSAYNVNKGTQVDSVYVKRYFSERSWGSGIDRNSRRPFTTDKDGQVFDASLKYDPGWNTFVPEVFNNRTPLMEDMGVMMVPTDSAVREWWENGGGNVIKAQYGTIENTPNSVLAELINVNMLNSLVASVPSKFDAILNDANLKMGVTLNDVKNVTLGCNGVVYLTKKVFAPASYSSVLFPAVIDTENLNIIKNAIDNMEYDAYLNSMVSTYSFFIPTNEGLLYYVDPVSFGKQTTELWEFHFDPTKASNQRIYVDVYACTVNEDGTITPANSLRRITGGTGNSQINNRLQDILDNIIGIEGTVPGKSYYLTKGKSFVKVDGKLDMPGQMSVAGSYQTEVNAPINVHEVFNMENGKAYVVDGVINSTRKATSDILAEHPEFSEFYEMLVNSGSIANTNTDGYCSASQNKDVSIRGNLVSTSIGSDGKPKTYSLLNAHHYTVYAPTNDAMQKAYAAGLPSNEDLALAERYDAIQDSLDHPTDSAEHVKSIQRDFIKYHIQSNSIFADNGFEPSVYESQKTRFDYVIDETTGAKVVTADSLYEVTAGAPYRITVTSVDPSGISLLDAMGNTVKVDMSTGLYNIQGREYWLNGTKVESATTIENSSTVVVHAIDSPLLYSKDQFIYVPHKVVAEESVKQRK